MAKHHVTVCLFSLSETGNTYLYVIAPNSQDKPARKWKIHPFGLSVDDFHEIEKHLHEFVSSQGVEDFTVFPTDLQSVYLVQIHRGYPKGEVRLRKASKALEHMERMNTVNEGIDGIETIRRTLATISEIDQKARQRQAA